MSIEGDVSYEEQPLRMSSYRRFKFVPVYGCLWVFISVMGVCRCMGFYGCIWVSKGVYGCIYVSKGVYGFSNVNRRRRGQ